MDKRPLEETSPTVLAVLRQPGSLAMPAAVVLGQARAQVEQSRYVREVDRLARRSVSLGTAWVCILEGNAGIRRGDLRGSSPRGSLYVIVHCSAAIEHVARTEADHLLRLRYRVWRVCVSSNARCRRCVDERSAATPQSSSLVSVMVLPPQSSLRRRQLAARGQSR